MCLVNRILCSHRRVQGRCDGGAGSGSGWGASSGLLSTVVTATVLNGFMAGMGDEGEGLRVTTLLEERWVVREIYR